MTIVLLVLVVMSVAVCIYEAVAERDWPRDTIKFPILFLAAFLLLASHIGDSIESRLPFVATVEHFLAEPVPNWLFLGIAAVLWYRDWQLRKGIELVAQILDDNQIKERPPVPVHEL